MSSASPPVARTVRDLRMAVARWRGEGFTVGLVPTMGALHTGHVSLVSLARTKADRAIASIFVNPKQFAEGEDFERYPRDEAGDAAMLAGAGCDLIYAPDAEVMYPAGHATSVAVAGVSGPLEGQSRPHFFGGVATVVTKLLLQCLPDVAVFGEKDYQQLIVIRRLVKDLDMPIEIVAGETVREGDGLAMSSRNRYLSPKDRETAGRLNRILADAVAALEAGASTTPTLVKVERAIFAAGFSGIDYVAVRSAENFSPIASPIVTRPARILAAVTLGGVRLIDNMAIRPVAR